MEASQSNKYFHSLNILKERRRRRNILKAKNSKMNVIYYPNWAKWRKGDGHFGLKDIDPSIGTHFIYAFLTVDNITYEIKCVRFLKIL